MTDAKDKRIKKLKKKRIWPSILGLFIITLIFAIILIVQLGIGAIDVVQSKIIDGLSQTENVAVVFKDYDGEQETQESVLIYLAMTPEVDAGWASDAKGNEV